jgi:hypothetical protein
MGLNLDPFVAPQFTPIVRELTTSLISKLSSEPYTGNFLQCGYRKAALLCGCFADLQR